MFLDRFCGLVIFHGTRNQTDKQSDPPKQQKCNAVGIEWSGVQFKANQTFEHGMFFVKDKANTRKQAQNIVEWQT